MSAPLNVDWIAVGTFAAAWVAALASLWAAIGTARQTHLLRRGQDRQAPIITASAVEANDPAWTTINFKIVNRAEAPIDLINAGVKKPKGILLLSRELVLENPKHHDPKTIMPYPVERGREEIAFGWGPEPAGTRSGSLNTGDTAYYWVHAHCRFSDFVSKREVQLRLLLRWRDQPTKTFAMAVNVVMPRVA